MENKPRRLFLGLPIPENVSKQIADQLQNLTGRLVPLQNWHITLHFLGNVEEERQSHIHKSLKALLWGKSYSLIFDHLGAFPKPKKAHTLWVGASKGASETNHLAQIISQALIPLGFSPDQRPFTPHLTVRRFSSAQNMTKTIDTHPFSPVSMQVDRIILYESILTQGLPQYEEVHVYDLGD